MTLLMVKGGQAMRLILLVAATILLTACSTEAQGKSEERFSIKSTNENHIYIVEDTETNCKYLLYSEYKEGGGITPLLNYDETPDCY